MSINPTLKNGNGIGIQIADLEAVNRDTREASGLPNPAYVSDQFAVLERDGLLAETWVCIGTAGSLTSPGQVKPVSIVGLPLVLVRDKSGINVFHNVCSHRGHQLVDAPCQMTGAIRCPYHSWTYGFDGRLKGTPHIGGPGVHEAEGFDKSRHGLKPVRNQTWMDLVFVNLSGNAAPLEEFLAPLVERWKPYLSDGDPGRLKLAQEDDSFSLEIAANWKLAVENFCEAYHLPWIHPGLNRYSKLEDHYHIIEPGHFAGQGTRVYDPVYRDGSAFPEFSGWPSARRKVAEYIALFPNLLLGLHVDHFYAVVLIPVAHDRTVEEMNIYYLDDAADADSYWESRRTTREAWRSIFVEDIGVVEGMQRGRNSPAFKGGAFSPVMDPPTHCFHRWVATGLLDAQA